MRYLPALALSLCFVFTAVRGARAEDPPPPEEPTPPATWQEAVQRLRKAEEVHGDAVGYAGVETPTYQAYAVLRDGAPRSELVKLTKDEAPVLRVYAFWALVEKHPDFDALSILRDHLDDAERVTGFPGGCCGWATGVGDWMLHVLEPKLDEEARAALDARLVEMGSPLDARDQALERSRLPDALHHTVLSLAEAGNEHALVALARYGRAEDRSLIEAALRSPIGDNEEWGRLCAGLRAVAVHPDPMLFPTLASRKGDFRGLTRRPPMLYHRALRAYGTPEALAILEELGVPAVEDGR